MRLLAKLSIYIFRDVIVPAALNSVCSNYAHRDRELLESVYLPKTIGQAGMNLVH